ncbi:MAG: methyltransferase domain-containing protein [Candidatus Pacebacteria bacterium]|nr:methyltransferase domain-containing protein [Candidatus Paceibacterota bacterium]
MDTIIPQNQLGEQYAEDIALLVKPTKVLGEIKSKYQTSTYVQTKTFGRLLFQDGLIYLADTGNEALFEMYTHIPMQTGKPKKRVLLIGAGDGYGIKHLLDYPSVEKVTAIDIDAEFVELSKKVYPEVAWVFTDPRVDFKSVDGAEFIKTTTEKFDFIVVTVGDPFTLSKSMFNAEFVQRCHEVLSDDGIISMDGYMPYYTHEDSLNYWQIFEMIALVFPITRIAHSTSPIMPGGLVTLIFGSKQDDPMTLPPRGDVPVKTVWYTPKIHQSSFILPQFLIDKLHNIHGFTQE